MIRVPVLPAFFAVLAVMSVSGCACRGDRVGTSTGEVAVVWKDVDGSQIVNRDAIYDFGKARLGEKKELELVIRNVGGRAISLSTLEVTEGDPAQITMPLPDAPFDILFAQADLNPADELRFKAYFSPTPLKSDFMSKLLLSVSGATEEGSTAIITLKGEGEAGACDLPDVIDFGNVPVGESYPYEISYWNPTSLPADGLAGDIVGDDAATFGYKADSISGVFSVDPESTTIVTMMFSPTEYREYHATVTLRGAGPCKDKVVNIVGVGSDQRIDWQPRDLNFGYVDPSAEAIREVVFTNPSNVPVVIHNVATDNPDFAYRPGAGVGPTDFVIQGGGVPTIMQIGCKPSSLGPRTGKLNFVTGLKSPASGTVSLRCVGGGPKIKVTPRPTVGFGKVGYFPGNPNYQVTRKITIQNVGSKPTGAGVAANLYLGKFINGTMQSPDLFQPPVPGQGTSLGEFQVELSPSTPYSQNTGIEAVAGKNSVDLVVTLRPQSLGPKAAKFVIESNDGSEPIIELDLIADVQQLPPCNYKVSPAMVNFGLVTPGTVKQLPVNITNLSTNPSEVCYLSGIDLEAGTSTAYTIAGGPIAEKELLAGETWPIVVELSPPGPVPSTPQNLLGTLAFNISSASQPSVKVPLRATIGPVCLVVTPDPMDFGTVRLGCSSSSKTFSVYNTCSSSVTVQSVSLQAGAGQQPGGPNCSGGNACPEFFLVSVPPQTTLQQAATPLTFAAKYKPIDVGADTGAIAINAIQSGQNVTYLVGLKGNGDMVGLETDTFVQDMKPKADILLVIDDSGSMSDKQTNLANNFASFIQYATSANVDYQIGVTTSSTDEYTPSSGKNGQLVSNPTSGQPPFITPSQPNVATKFAQMVKVGTNGDYIERPLEGAVMALTPPMSVNQNANFIRQDANLAVVIISDAEDQSSQAVSYYQNRLVNVKGFNQLSRFTFNAIVPMGSPTSGCIYDDSSISVATRYNPIVSYTGGVKAEICNSNWAATLQSLGKTSFGFRTQFFLKNTPDLMPGSSFDVQINGTPVPASSWTYDAASNAIVFSPTATPGPGQTLTITYKSACF